QRNGSHTIPFSLREYLALVDWTGRVRRRGKRGSIAAHLPPIMQRLKIDDIAWRQTMGPRGNRFGRAIGSLDRLRAHAGAIGQSWVRGLQAASSLFSAE